MEIPFPNLVVADTSPLKQLESAILAKRAEVEAWFRKQWMQYPPTVTSSVDLRNSGFKLAPVDTNLFPAGFNNLNPDSLPLCIQAAQAVLTAKLPGCIKVIIIPEMHTRNQFYQKSLSVLVHVIEDAGFVVRLGSFDPEITEPTPFGEEGSLVVEPLRKENNRLVLEDFNPCLILLNNDLSAGVPDLLKDVEQPIYPVPSLGWSYRLKSHHFHFYAETAESFANLVGVDPWLMNPLFSTVSDIDFLAKEGIERLAQATSKLLEGIRDKYQQHGVEQTPFVAIKSDSGTYGMSVMMVQDPQEIMELNRKKRTKMAASKGGNKVNRVILQEGIHTFEAMPNGAVAEPVVYMLGQYVIGGFYRVHQGRGADENLNAPGMHFEPLAFEKPCNVPLEKEDNVESPNRFYVYGVIARLAALAAAKESV